MTAAAHRYAAAMFQLAAQGKQAAAVGNAVAALSQAVADVALARGLGGQQLSRGQRLQLAQAMAKAAKAPPVMENTLKLMAANNRLADVPAMLKAYGELSDNAAGIVPIQVRTAARLTEQQRLQLRMLVKNYTHAKDTRLEETVDPTLIGGFRALFAGRAWDTSLSGGLARLAARLKAGVNNHQI